MPSSYTASARFTLQATGENNNTWGVILNQGVFQLVDDSINGRLAISLSGPHTLTVNQGATDEARMAFIDVTGGSGGVITAPSVPKSYFVHNGSSGGVQLTGGATPSPVFNPGDAGPLFTDGTTFYPVLIGGLTIKAYADAGDAAQKAYTDASIASASAINLPSVAGHAGQFLGTDGSVALWEPAPIAWRNRLDNGGMRIQQRAAGATVLLAGGSRAYPIDRWAATMGAGTAVGNAAQTTVNWAPVTLNTKALQISITTAQATLAVGQAAQTNVGIEGLRIADLAWGTPNAVPVTVQAVLAATVAGDYFIRLASTAPIQSYVHKVTLAASTTTKVAFTVQGPTSGTWPTDSSFSLGLGFCLGAGANFQTSTFDAWIPGNFTCGASQVNVMAANGNGFWLTDVQLEVGSVATPFERRPYAVELQLCQRYYENNMPGGVAPAEGAAIGYQAGGAYATNTLLAEVLFKVEKRTAPIVTLYRANVGVVNGQWSAAIGPSSVDMSASGANRGTTKRFEVGGTVPALAQGQYCLMTGGWAADADF